MSLSSQPAPPHLIVGLGNPGREYKNTRHNVGFEAVDRCARRIDPPAEWKTRPRSAQSSGHYRRSSVIFLKPRTWMNASGPAVREIATVRQIPLRQILVISDDIAIPFGSLRLRLGGSSGGHNGLKSVQLSLQSCNFARLRVGIGRPVDQSLDEFVLAQFARDERERLPKILDQVSETALKWTAGDSQALMTEVNSWICPT